MVTIPKSDIIALCHRAFEKAGLTDKTMVDIIINHLMHNEMTGKTSHGLLRVKWCISSINDNGLPDGQPKLALDVGGLGVIDGRNNIGVVAGEYAARAAIEKAKEHGIAFVGARNHHGTTGTMHYYNSLFVEHGLVGIAGCNSLAMVCHPDGFDPVIGTNPISFGIPSAKTPCIIDVTSAQWAYGKLLDMHQKNDPMPVDAFVDKDGKPSVDIRDAMEGAMLPMNGIKGFSIGLAIEILGGALIGAKSGRDAIKGSDGIFFITIDPDKIVGRDRFENEVEKLLQEVKSSRHGTSVSEPLIPGERSKEKLKKSMINNYLSIGNGVYNDLKELSE
ncbi:MAG: Ldh family oxidoreductase [Alphaproteobacteria bacterium]